jgi:hypothetical protein
MALMEEDPKDVALALLLGWQYFEGPISPSGDDLYPLWWRYCDHIEYSNEPKQFRGTNQTHFCLIRPTAACCVERDTKQLTPEVTS